MKSKQAYDTLGASSIGHDYFRPEKFKEMDACLIFILKKPMSSSLEQGMRALKPPLPPLA
jgi:hypothetical protein